MAAVAKRRSHHVVVGRGFAAINAALHGLWRRREMRHATPVFLDWRGRAAMMLTDTDAERLQRSRVLWVDLGARLAPASLSGVTSRGASVDLMTHTLRAIGMAARRDLPFATIAWVADLVARLADDGPVNLASLHRHLLVRENRTWLVAHDRASVDDIATVERALRWAFGFPLVYALSASPDVVDLYGAVSKGRPVWLEMPFEHAERGERIIVTAVVLMSVLDALLRLEPADNGKASVVVFHITPESSVFSPPWIVSSTSPSAYHVAVLHYGAGGRLSGQEMEWLALEPETWLAGPTSKLDRQQCASWLPEETFPTASELGQGQILVGRNQWERTVVARSRHRANGVSPAHSLRLEAFRGRRRASTARLGHTVAHRSDHSQGSTDLYARLTNIETLRRAWLRVRRARASSHGIDGVTIGQFAASLEHELESLREDLARGRYRAKPLRRVTIRKADGGQRHLGLCCVRDRVVQAACLELLEPDPPSPIAW